MIKDFAPISQVRKSALAIESIILVYVALNMAKETGEAAAHQRGCSLHRTLQPHGI